MLKEIIINGARISYNEIGFFKKDLPTILLLHGACQDMSTWENQFNFLNSYTRYNSIALDLPGHGRSGGEALKSIDQNSKFLLHFINELDLKQIILLGHSMGGRIAQLFCIEYPQYVIGCILAATGVRIRITRTTFNILQNDFKKFCEMATSNSFSESADYNTKKTFFNKLISSNKQTCINDMTACDEYDVSSNISRINIPVLIIAGASDVLAPVRYSRELYREIKDSRLSIINSSGHFMMIENPSVFNSALKKFLDFL